ncbi:LOW QUALITY PROTEIN: hypothetical protein V2J09_015338 [Rumex salicifolius]
MSSALLLAYNSIKKTTSTLSPFHYSILRTQFFTSLLYSTFPHCKHAPEFSSAHNADLPPAPKRVPFKVTHHGRSWTDPYHWMSNTSDPDFIAYINQENAYSQAFMADTLWKQKELCSEMTSKLPAKISTAPERWGDWLYYQYIPEGEEYPVLCRIPQSNEQGWSSALLNYMKGASTGEEILLDWNEIVRKYGYVHVGTCRISPDHNFLAYTLDTTGAEQFILQVKDLRDGLIIPRVTVAGVVSLAWAQDSSTLVLCTEVGSNNVCEIFTENDPSFCVDITCTKDGKYITVNSNSRTSSEVYVLDSTKPLNGLRRVHKRLPGVRYFLEHHHGFFYVLTNCPLNKIGGMVDGAYYLARCKVEDSTSRGWQSILLPGEGTTFQDMDIFSQHLVLLLENKGCSKMCSINLPLDINDKVQVDVRLSNALLFTIPTSTTLSLLQHVMELTDLKPWFFPVPSDSCRMVPGSNHDFMTSAYRVVLSCPVMPDLVIDYIMSQKSYSVVHQEEVVGISPEAQSNSIGMNLYCEEVAPIKGEKDTPYQVNGVARNWRDYSATYCCERHEVVSHDGVRIPLTLIYSRSCVDKGQYPGLLHVYGAYGEELDKSWCPDRLSLLDCGWVIAFADVRGGSGGDSSWHECGSGAHKINSIHDLISCSKYLMDEGYVKRDRLACIGYSAGSLVVGAAINFYPDLFRAAILKVPFLDICNTLLDPSLPLTILDYEEFGNPEIQSDFENIMEILLSCNACDSIPPRFQAIWEAAKWVAKIREKTCRNCSQSVILKTEMTGGHFSEGGRLGQCEEKAYEYAFLMKSMGMLVQSDC